jgi:hypothetical protein
MFDAVDRRFDEVDKIQAVIGLVTIMVAGFATLTALIATQL